MLKNTLLPKIIAFDVFGTVVDWHSSISNELKNLNLGIDPDLFANAWRKGYYPAMARVRSGELPWTKIDHLHRMMLDQVLKDFKITSLSEEQKKELNLVWHRLVPWPDTVEGLTRLKAKFTITTLSNGNLSLLSNMAKNGALPWDLILSAEVFKHYKPDPETYLGVAELFEISPNEVMLAAAHTDDLLAAQQCGLQTAYIHRPFEFGQKSPKNMPNVDFFDYSVNNLLELSQILCKSAL
ncbi:MAG: haloacid dehalogenase type II [Betaproteobacteria bacterium]|jgi:2-haloacid dehalogenase